MVRARSDVCSDRPWQWWALWTSIVAVSLWYLEGLRVPSTFFFDEWDVVLDSRPIGIDMLLEPHNGHLSVVPIAAYRLGLALFGADHYAVFRVAGLLCHAAVATVTGRYVLRRHGQVAALAAGAVVLLLGAGWENVLWPFQIGFMTSVATGIGAWLAIDRRSTSGDVAAGALVALSLAASGVGVSFAVGAVVRFLVVRDARSAVRSLALPLLVFALWWVFRGEAQGGHANAGRMPRFVVDAAASSVAALAGRDVLWGRVALGGLLGAVLVLPRGTADRSRRAAISVAIAATAWLVLTAWSRAGESVPGSSRYMYVGAVFTVLLASDLVRPVRSLSAAAVTVVLAMLGVWGNHRFVTAGADFLRERSTVTRVELRAIEWAVDPDPDYRADMLRMPQVAVGPYLDLVADRGSPAATDGEVLAAPDWARQEVDRVALELFGLVGARSAMPPQLSVDPPAGCTWHPVAVDGSGQAKRVFEHDTAAELAVRGGAANVELRLRRFSGSFAGAVDATVGAGGVGTVSIGVDRSPVQEWSIEVVSAAAYEYCVGERD